MQTIDTLLGLPAMISLGLGILLLLFAVGRIRRGRLVSGTFQGLFAFLLLAGAGIFLMLGINLYTYHRLTLEEEVASIRFWQAGPQQFLAVLTMPGTLDEQNYMIHGDEWQIDARILKWTAPAILSGLNSRYRLERLSGRYQDIRQEKQAERSVFELSTEPGFAIWPLLTGLRCCSSWIDTYYGNSTYMPMIDQGAYTVYLTQSGIIARAANENAERAIREWN